MRPWPTSSPRSPRRSPALPRRSPTAPRPRWPWSGRPTRRTATTRRRSRCASRASSSGRRATSPPSSASRIASDDVEAVEVAGPGFLNLRLSAAWYRARAGAHPRRGRPLRRGAAGAGAAAAGGVRVGEPDGRPHGRLGPQRRVRRLRRARCWSSPATRSRASTTSTTRAGRSSCSASRCARARLRAGAAGGRLPGGGDRRGRRGAPAARRRAARGLGAASARST